MSRLFKFFCCEQEVYRLTIAGIAYEGIKRIILRAGIAAFAECAGVVRIDSLTNISQRNARRGLLLPQKQILAYLGITYRLWTR